MERLVSTCVRGLQICKVTLPKVAGSIFRGAFKVAAVSDDLIFPLICMSIAHLQTATLPLRVEFPVFLLFQKQGELGPSFSLQLSPGYLSDFFPHHSLAGSALDTMTKIFLSLKLYTHCSFNWEHPVPGSCTFGCFFTFVAQLSVISGRTYPN